MDIALTPKLIAAALVGATLATKLPRAAPVDDTVVLKLEWVQSDKRQSQSITMRTMFDKPTTLRQGPRTVEARPSQVGDGSLIVSLKVTTEPPKGETETLTTQVHVLPGETNVVMGSVKKDGNAADERLFLITANPL